MKIAPQAKMDDGQLDVCMIGGVDPFKLFCMFPTVYSGRHLNIREVEYFQAGRVRVETEHPLDVYADGEYVCRTPVEVAARAALKVMCSRSWPSSKAYGQVDCAKNLSRASSVATCEPREPYAVVQSR